MARPPLSDHARGLAITLTGVLVLTPDALLIRLPEVDHWTIAFWRGLLLTIALMAAISVITRGRLLAAIRATGRPGAVAAVLYGINSVLFVYAITHTLVANVLVIIAASPLFAAVMSGIFLKEHVRPITWAAILTSIAGIALVVGDGLGAGTWRGDFAALGVAVTLATTFTIMRRSKHVSMVPGTAVGGLVAAAIALPLADPLSPQGIDIFWIGLLGLVVIPIAFGLITTGPRYLPAPEVGLIMLLETVLGPIWVWIALGEEPPPMSLVGGAIVILTLAVHSLVRLRQQRAARRARPGAIAHVGPVTTDPGEGEKGK